MKYALGNMLNGAGGLNADQLALDLQFAADKTLTARRGPTPILTRGSTGTFVGSNGLIQTAAVNAARFDHDPVTLASRGLLIEEGRTNLSLYSGALVVGTGWGGNGATSATSSTGPDGNTSYIVSEDSSNGQHFLSSSGGLTASNATSVTSGITYTASIFIKKVTGSVDWIQLTCGSAGFGSAQYANFNIGNGTTGNSAGLASGTSPRIENYGNGWYRCSITVTATATTNATSNLIIGFIQNTNGTTRLPSYTGSTSNSVLASLCQFEAGSFPTSYIPTTTSALARSADVCSITGANFTNLWNASEGTIFAAYYQYGATGFGAILTADGGTDIGKVQIARIGTTQGVLSIKDNANNDVFSYAPTSSLVSGRNKSSLAYKQNDSIATINNLSSALDTSVTLGTQTQLLIGNDSVAAGRRHNGAIDSIRVYKKRLSLAKLQALTA